MKNDAIDIILINTVKNVLRWSQMVEGNERPDKEPFSSQSTSRWEK
ncbi:hypothetical protein ScFU53_00830 [Streptococcus canis]|nr:uncharacterized protein TANIYAMA4_0346 [Streptococcus canis]GEE06730.1 hypothetical protein ScOT1_08230 [Streptococcus canis]GFE42336.1 hypothetical protein ScFU1_00180 [Streptococcus canis]GFE45734.1 hypothetical protein ScFU6_15030 [Streptococcus canis]GFE47862.1 hypothetical protein ScFU129_14930 [Streptococcus canis]